MLASDNFKETLKQQADIVRIVGDYVKLKKAGAQNFSGLCPFHAEKTPSFSVHATRQFFHCFGCGESGDIFTFIQKVENITFPEAIRLIAQKLGIPMPKMAFSSPEEARDAHLRMALLDVHVRATQFFQECLRRPEGANAREYLKGRGLDSETIARFRIGYAPDSGFALKDALRREFDEDLLRESGLFSWKEDSRQPSAVSHQEKQVLRSAQDDNPVGASDANEDAQETPGEDFEPKAKSQEPPPPSTPNSAIVSCSRSPTTRAKSSPSPDAPSPPTTRPGRNISTHPRPPSTPSRGYFSISTTPKKPSASSNTPSSSKARWIASPCTPPDSTT